ncbi:MAG: GH92 family glycosyl hydrolase [Marinilabiliaceae bacterium]|nr:GH92 family glycosyl hydrolase [Marinilabiliaceae bacterium]
MIKRSYYLLLVLLVLLSHNIYAQKDLAQYVDPFIGSEGAGHVFPGASLPYGMVKLGPDCGNKTSNTGYAKNEEVHGFSHTHVSGTGGGAKYGNVLVMPVVGDVKSIQPVSLYRDAIATPGFFSMQLTDYNIQADLTVSHKVGFHKYTFPKSNQSHIIIDAGSFLGDSIKHAYESQEFIGSEIEILSNTRVEGYTRVRNGWGLGGEYTVFFSAEVDTPAESFFLSLDNRIDQNGTVAVDNGTKAKAILQYSTSKNQQIQVKVGISFISAKKARQNLENEVSHWDFNKVHDAARQQWNDVLATINIEGATDIDQTIFYSSLYRTMLMPVDRTGENPKWHSDEPYYDDYYAIWDTYRATHPLMTLIQSERERDMVRSLVDIYRYDGYMPDARSGNHNGRTQGGSNCDMLIADAYLKGLKGIDYEAAFDAMVKNAEIPPGGTEMQEGRGGINEYIELGYVPAEFEPLQSTNPGNTPKLYERAGTRTVEYAANDWAIAQVAKELGRESEYIKFKRRAGNWANLWRDIKCDGFRGFIWPRREDGTWVNKFSAFKAGSWGNFFYESNSWEYSFYVPHDVASLIDSCGGQKLFIQRLDHFFNNNYFNVTNEPGFLSPYLYNYAGQPYKTNALIRSIIRENYNTNEDGVPGNDDAGSMAAWYVFSSMGFFPNAGQDVYLIGAPHFKEVTLNLGNNKQLIIKAKNLSEENSIIKTAKLNGKSMNRAWFRHFEIANGGLLEFEMTNTPTDWGQEMLPPSMSEF